MLNGDTLHNIARGTMPPPDGTVSIVLPHFETPLLARLCLRAIRKRTDVPFEVIVVDNASTDGESLDYLRRVSWIRLIERPADTVPPEAALAHATALNIGLAEARGEFLLAMHTDTLPLRDDWLAALRQPMLDDPKLAALGADKIDGPGPVMAAMKPLGNGKAYRRLLCRMLGREVPERLRERPPHARSFCALYRRKALVDGKLDFLARRYKTAGEDIYHGLAELGYHVRLLPPREMRQLVEHVVHATALLSEQRTINTGRVRRRTERRIRRLLAEPWVAELLEDESLDTR
ncbi:MAG: glycosyltransferase family 2 protein [Planctomycetes bacterium]|nr:glycosyltransferase family 2 protein [Planctomycetota bacterium]